MPLDRKGQYISYAYDQLNRLTQKAYPDRTVVNYTYDNDSRLTQVTDPTGTYSFTFDNMGRLTQAESQYAFLTGRNFTTSYTYDAASNRTGFTDPESGSTSYAYDTLNRLQTLTPPSAFTGGNFGFGYDALSRRTSLTRPNSITTNYSYDNLSRLLSVVHKNGSTTLDGASYTVDNADNRTAKTDQYANVTSNYTYDPIYELTQVTQGTSTTESYSYDRVGNRTASLGVSSYTTNSSNELTSTSNASYTYDNNGNALTKVVGSNTTSYALDYENRLTSVTLPGSGGTVSFAYDPFGRRIYKSSSSGTSVYAYDGNNLVEETNSSGSVVARYTQNWSVDEPLAVLRSSTTSYYEQDGVGSVNSLSNAAGAIANSYTYDSFGNLVASTGTILNSFRYTGREFDTEANLYFSRARYYDPSTGRFLSEDSVLFYGGVNFSNYVGGNPLRYRDPLGLSASSVVGSFLTGAAAGAAGAVIVGGVALGAVTLGAPVAVVTGVLGLAAIVGGAALGIDVFCNFRSHNWDGLAFNIGSLAGSFAVGGVGGRFLAEGINGAPSPSWSLGSDPGDAFQFNYVDPATGQPGSFGSWLGKGPNPASAGGSAGFGGAGGATAVHQGACGCK